MIRNGNMRKPREEKRPSCNRCRLQKLRCDAHLDLSKPCSRCRRLKTECTLPTDRLRKSTAPQRNYRETSASLSNSSVGSRGPLYPNPGKDLMTLPSLNSNLLLPAPVAAAGFRSFSQSRVSTQILEGMQVEGRVIEACFQQYVLS